jgi:hypothetical protein
MDAFISLRQQAADKRDAAIKVARNEFRATLRQIEQLRFTLGDAIPTPRDNGARTIPAIVLEVMPRDKTFTVEDIMKRLAVAEPARQFKIGSVRIVLRDLSGQGRLRKVCRTVGGIVHWAHPDCDVAYGPIDAMTIVDAARQVLEESGPLSPTEIVVNLKERGYREDADPRMLLQTLREAIKRNREKFVKSDGGKWALAGT